MSIASHRERPITTETSLWAVLRGVLLCSLLLTGLPAGRAQSSSPDAGQSQLPNVSTLLEAVQANQRTSETVRKNYLYHAVQTFHTLDGHGGVKKTEVREYDDFWINGVPVQKLVKKDGKALSPDEQKKEDEHIDKEVAKARERREKADASGKQSDPYGNEEITVSRLIELGSFTNPRRVLLNSRNTIALDYAGDPKAKTRNRNEEVIRDLVGTVWIDEQDRQIARIEGHFLNAFRLGAGLLMDIQKGTSFSLAMQKVNDEAWLPARIEASGAARVLLLINFHGEFTGVFSDYRRFRTTSTILPDVTQKSGTQENAPASEPSASPASPSTSPH